MDDIVEAKSDSEVKAKHNEGKHLFSPLWESVKERYVAQDSSIAGNSEQLQRYIEHIGETHWYFTERGVAKKMTDVELRMGQAAVILHDGHKTGKPPEGYEDIENYMLANHNNIAADAVREDLSEAMIAKILGKDSLASEDETEKEEVIERVSVAIRSHMGPRPGFMTLLLAGVNKDLVIKGLPVIKHPSPSKGDVVAETLLASDMASLASRKGREKVLAIQASDPFFRSLDQKIVSDYKKAGISLKMGESALLLGFKSAEEAREMINDNSDKMWINNLIEESKSGEYKYNGETVTYEEAHRKQQKYEKLLEK